MKKTIHTLVAILLASLSFAQGGGFNYKALITDNGNVLNTQPVTFKFTVLENGTTSVYQETQSATTDANGIVAVNVGEGTVVSGNFNTIDWGSNPYFLKVEIDTSSGYQDFGTTEFKAVPYAKFAEKAGNVFSGNFGDLSNVPAGLSDGDNDTHLTESQVDSYVSNNGYLTQVDNIRGIPVSSTAPTNGQILKYNGSQFVPADDDTSGGSGTDGVVNSAAFSGTSTKTLTLGRSNGLGNVTANFTDNDTHLTDAQIGAMGYIKNANDADHSTTNELQNLILNSTQLSISNGNNVNFTGWDTNAADDFDGDFSSLSNVPAGLSDGDDDTHLTDAQIGAMGYIKNANDADHDATNEIQNLTLNSTQLSISNGNNVNFSGWDTDASDDFDGDFSSLSNVPAGLSDGDDDTHLTDAQITAMGYIKNANDADHSTTNELQNLTLNNTQLSISNGNNVNFSGWDTNASDDFDGNFSSLSNVPAGLADGDDDTTYTAGTGITITGTTISNTGDTDASDDVQSMDDLTDAKYGGYSLFIGVGAGFSDDSTDNNNVGIGYSALQLNTSGEGNTANGVYSLKANRTGSYNTALGYLAGNSNQTGSGNIFLGYQAGYAETGSNKLYIENSASATPLIGGDFSTDEVTINGSIAIKDGTQGANKVLTSDASGKASWVSPAIGATEIDELSDARYDGLSLFLGQDAGLNDDGTNNRNVGVGLDALRNNISGYYNTANGEATLRNNTTGYSNTANGSGALYSNTTGNHNTALGTEAGYSNVTGYGNVFLGNEAGYYETGSQKLYIENSDSTTPLIGGDFSTNEVTINGNIDITKASGNTLATVSTQSGDADLYIKSTGTNNPGVHFYLDNSFKTSIGYNTSQQAFFIYHNGNTYFKNGNILPDGHKSRDLGANGTAWRDVYADNFVNQGAAAFTDRSVTAELILHKPIGKKDGDFDAKTPKGLYELNPDSLPDALRAERGLLIDEMTTYNYKANYEQQVQINELKALVEQQRKLIEKLSKKLEELEKKK